MDGNNNLILFIRILEFKLEKSRFKKMVLGRTVQSFE